MEHLKFIATLFLLACSAMPKFPEKPPDLVTIPQIRPLLWQLVSDGGLGFRHMEETGFLVVHDGRFTVVRWPAPGEAETGRWYGALPDGAIAIVHTHPAAEPMPSRTDIQTALRTGLPVYVLTPLTIAKTSGGEPQVVLRGGWSPLQVACASWEKRVK
jgi:hypothetical protein